MGVDIEPLSFQGSWATGLGPSPLFTPVRWANMIIFNMIKVVKLCFKPVSYCLINSSGLCGGFTFSNHYLRLEQGVWNSEGLTGLFSDPR